MADDLNSIVVEANQADKSASSDRSDLYDTTSLFLMAVDPSLVHVIWQVTDADLEKIKQQCAGNLSNGLFVLKLFDAEHDSSGINPLSLSEVVIDLDDKRCYVPLQESGKAYFSELVFKTVAGDSLTLGRSNVAETPQQRPVWKNIPKPKAPVIGAQGLIPADGALSDALPCDNIIALDPPVTIDVMSSPQGLLGKGKLAKILNNQYIDAIEVLKNTEAMTCVPAERIRSSVLPSVVGCGNCSRQSERGSGAGCDLTEMAERKFISGVSSS